MMSSMGYTYKTTEEIIGEIQHLSDFSSYEFIILFFTLGTGLLLIYYILPLINLSLEYKNIDNKSIQRRRFIEKISLQKELEDEISKEIHEENK